MSDLKQFEVPAVADLVENYEELEIYAYRDGYRDCLEQTNAKELYEAIKWFCQRVENGEVKSVKTYAKFKEIISKATEKPQP